MGSKRKSFTPKQELRNRIRYLEALLDKEDEKNDFNKEMLNTLRECFERLFPVAFGNPQLIQPHCWGARANPSKDHEKHREYFKFIPMIPEEILKAVLEVQKFLMADFKKENPYVYDMPRKSFLDVGCGLGNVMLLASSRFDVYGVEFSEEYVQAARKMLNVVLGRNDMDSHVIHRDALDYNQYNNYDVIYWYRPISNSKLMNDLATKVVKQMKVGAYLIPLSHSTIWRSEKRPEDWDFKDLISITEHPSFQPQREIFNSRIIKKIATVE